MNIEKYKKMDRLAYLGHVNQLSELIDSDIDINWADGYGYTVLMSAVMRNRANAIRLLLASGANPNMQNYHGETALFLLEQHLDSMAKFICVDVLKTAMSKTIEGRNNQLISSANIGNLDSIKELIQAGANVNFQTNCGFTALLYAIAGGHVDCVEYLIKAGANVNLPINDGRTPLMFTWGGEYQKCVDLLLAAGADIHIKSKAGFTAITENVMRADTVKKLIDRGGLVDEPSKDGWTALMAAAYDDYVDSVELLINSGANVNLQDEDGRTALMIAAAENSHRSLKLLLAACADPSIKNNEGETALDIAKRNYSTAPDNERQRKYKKCIKILSQVTR